MEEEPEEFIFVDKYPCKNPRFQRTNDVAYLTAGYNDLERRLLQIKLQGKTAGKRSREKQRMWNQVSALKSRLRNKEHSIIFECAAKSKDQKAEALLRELHQVVTSCQFDLIKLIIKEKWAAVDREYNKKHPIEILEEGTKLNGRIRPSTAVLAPSNHPERKERGKGSECELTCLFSTPAFVFKYFQPNEESEC